MISPCCCACLTDSDDFNRTEKINGIVGSWSGIPNRAAFTHPDHFWVVFLGLLRTPSWDGAQILTVLPTAETTTLPSGPYRLTRLVAPPRHFSASIEAGLLAEGKVRLVYEAISTNPFLSKRFGVEIEASLIRFSQDGFDTECGYMRLWDLTNLSGEIMLSEVPVPGLCASLASDRHKLTLCYDPETRIISAHVLLSSTGATHAMHKFDFETCPDSFLSGATLWLEVMNFPTAGTVAGAFRPYFFDNWRVSQTKNLPNDETGDYGDYGVGIGDDELAKCPCCGPRGCQQVDIDLTNPDCRVTGSGDLKTYRGSWSGIGDDCQPDHTTHTSVTFRSSADGASVTLYVNATGSVSTLSAVATLGDAMTDGTLVVAGRTAVTVPGLRPGADLHSLSLCYDGTNVIGVCDGAVDYAEATDPGGTHVSIDIALSDFDEVGTWSISHDVNGTSGCPDCFGELTGDADWVEGFGCDPCARWRRYMAVKVSGSLTSHTCGTDVCTSALETFIATWAHVGCTNVIDCCALDWAAFGGGQACEANIGCGMTLGIGVTVYRDPLDGRVKAAGSLGISAVSGAGFCPNEISISFGPVEIGDQCAGMSFTLPETSRTYTPPGSGAAAVCDFAPGLSLSAHSL